MTRFLMPLVVLAALITAAACQAGGEEVTTPPSPTATNEEVKTITLGDISGEPAAKIKLFQPLADYLAANLSEFGIQEGRVVVAPSMEAMAELLIAHGADINIANNEGDTPLHYAVTNGHMDIAELLKHHGATE